MSSAPARREKRAGLLVQKFGGTSVADLTGFEACAEVIRHHGGDGQVIVVLSAVKGVTDLLQAAIDQSVDGAGGSKPLAEALGRQQAILNAMASKGIATPLGTAWQQEQAQELAQRIEGVRLLGQCPDRIRARILASGEGFSSRLMADLLQHHGVAADWSDTDVLPLANDD